MDRRDFLLSSTLAAAAAATVAPNGPVLAQTSVESEPGVNMDRPNTAYEGSKLNRKLEIVNLMDLEPEAQKILPTGGFGYISGGSGANWTRRENTEAFSRVQIEPLALSGVAKVDLATEILGSKLSFPVFIPPMGSHGLAHVDKEAATARGAAAVGTLMTTSTVSNLSLEEIASNNPGPKWFQFYVPTDRGYTRELIQRVKAAGYTAIAPTVDNVWSYPREENIRNVFRPPSSLGRGNLPRGVDAGTGAKMLNARKRDLDWKDLEWIKAESGLAVMPKGVMSAKAAQMAVKVGLDGVWVSNHGGRAFDGVQATITMLPRIAQAVDGRVPIVFDSGVRRADHVFKALALGATVVGMGRPIMYGLALGGAQGVQSVLEHVRDNLTIIMRLAGTKNIKEINRDYLAAAAIA
ncbi:MAG TPA: alpha-hydroxy-acid oxidizing protein [Xanthobacteraceae bacterium]|nr:alpha-hydroxy-acid oxidizing protein [Xanthobacteraceae bacterium]